MPVEVLLDTEIHVHYGFLTLCSAQTEPDDDSDVDAWRGQVNGLVGAAVPEMLRIRTDIHTGPVVVRIELHDREPELDHDWTEVVEIWFASWVDDLTLSAFEEFDGPIPLPPGSYLPAGWPHHYLLSSLGRAGHEIGIIDPALAVHLTTTEPRTLRTIAGWAVEQALTMTEIRDLPGVDEALAGIRRGGDLSPDLVDPDRFEGLLPPPHFESEDSAAVERLRHAMAQHRAVELLVQSAAPLDMERTCSILVATGRLTGGRPDWIVAAVRHVFPHLVPGEP